MDQPGERLRQRDGGGNVADGPDQHPDDEQPYQCVYQCGNHGPVSFAVHLLSISIMASRRSCACARSVRTPDQTKALKNAASRMAARHEVLLDRPLIACPASPLTLLGSSVIACP